ncbi:MAG: hypothetical protein ABIR47_13810 [Candidatus Kapaibacterium sp.]
MATQKQQKSPANVFLGLAAVNAFVGILFLVFYFLYRSSGGSNSSLMLLASGAGFVAAVASISAYRYFKAKLEKLGKK